MDWNDNGNVDVEKAKFLTKIGCFIWIVLGILFFFVPAWLYFSYSEETRLKVSYSPNNINAIEIIRKDNFPDPTIRINYDNKSIMKTKIPADISVEWKNDYEAFVILTMQGREPQVVNIEFEELPQYSPPLD